MYDSYRPISKHTSAAEIQSKPVFMPPGLTEPFLLSCLVRRVHWVQLLKTVECTNQKILLDIGVLKNGDCAGFDFGDFTQL